LISVGHCIICPLNYGFWLPLWYLLAIVLSVLWITASDYLFNICWPLYCLSFQLPLLITHLTSVDHCIVCPLNYGFWLSLWCLLAIVLSVLWITASDNPFDICWPLYCLSFELRLPITSLIYFGHCIVCPLNYGFWLPPWYTLAIVLSVLWITASDYLFHILMVIVLSVLWITASDYTFDILWPLYCMSFELHFWLPL
jgi:hypothetical protein